ncbi:MAG: hypothetical protein Q7J54_02720 [Candidatus Woesearchaeota archaeon]|nr:hypothetical protein [Candidatus Woesearchaeota archaeon]
MTITELVQSEHKNTFVWADTKKIARVKRNIGEPIKIDLANDIHPNWREKPIEFAKLEAPYRQGLPRGTEVSLYIISNQSSSEHPSITVQYVEARR